MPTAARPFFDTHTPVKRLGAALDRQSAAQQEKTAQATHEADGKMAQAILALKNHMDAHHAETQKQFREMDAHHAETRERLARLEGRTDGQFKLLYWMLGILITGVTATVLKIFLD